MRFVASLIAFGLLLVPGPAFAATAKPVPVPSNPVELDDPSWHPEREHGGRAKASPNDGLRLGAVYPSPPGRHPQPQEAFSVINPTDKPLSLRGLRIELQWESRGKTNTAEAPFGIDRDLAPGEEIWFAADAQGFAEHFGEPPHAASANAGGPVFRLDDWPGLPDHRGIIRLAGHRGVTDTIAYNLTTKPWLPEDERLWRGTAINPRRSSFITARRQLIRRDRDAHGRLLPERDGAADYDGGTWASAYGDDPVHRVALPGQSFFTPKRHYGPAEVVVTSSPDNNFRGLIDRFDAAKSEVLVSIYHFTNAKIAEALIRASKRGVAVKVYAEGVPVGGLSERSLELYRRLIGAGVEVMLLIGDSKKGKFKRFRYDHSKYAIVDRQWVIVGTENYGSTGHPEHTHFGNRGWEIQVKNPSIVADLLKVWQWDTARVHRDVVIGDRRLQLKVGKHASKKAEQSGTHSTARLANYRGAVKPTRFSGSIGAQLVLSPDNSLAEEGAVLGMVRGAKKELLILQNSFATRWGRGRNKVASPLMDAVLAAARRGVRVRVLLDGVFYQLDPKKRDGNDDTVRFLNGIARAEGLDIEARIIDLGSLGLAKIHAKGVIADGDRVFVGSQNWSENSFRGNREVGLALEHPKIAAYYRNLFMRDWQGSPWSRHRLLRAAKVGGKRLARDTVVGLEFRGPKVCRVRRGDWVGEIPCELLGEQMLTVTQTYLAPHGVSMVRGRPKSIHKGRKFWSLNFGDFWRHDFSVQIPAAMAGQLAGRGIDFDKLVGQALEVRGELGRYNGPNLRVKAIEDIRLLTENIASSPWP